MEASRRPPPADANTQTLVIMGRETLDAGREICLPPSAHSGQSRLCYFSN